MYSMIYLSKLGIVDTNNDSEHVPTTAVLHQFVIQFQTWRISSNLMSHMCLLSICLLCWPDYRSSPFSHRRKFVAKIFRLFLFTRSWFLLGGKTPAELHMKSQQRVWISVSNWTNNLGPCEDKGPKLLEHAPEIFKRVSKQYPDMLKCVHIYRKTWGCCWIILTPTAPDFAGDLDVPFAGWHGARLGHPHGGTEPLPMRPYAHEGA